MILKRKKTTSQKLIIGIILIVLFLISYLTYDVINETDNNSFDIDFKNKDNIISAYGSLIGGILSFLSILFVLYSLLEQREQIKEEKNLKEQENKYELLDKLSLLSNYFNSTIEDIQLQGESLKEYYTNEIESPSDMHKIYFTSNKNFSRIIDMDPMSIYKAIRNNFKENDNWENLFLSIYSLYDFYSEGLVELRNLYVKQVRFKDSKHKQIAEKLRKLLDLCSKLTEEYRTKYSENYLEYSWPKLVKGFEIQYYNFLIEYNPNVREISDNFLLPFIDDIIELRKSFDNEIDICHEILTLTSNIRKDIKETEDHCIDYALDIKKLYNEYFKTENKNILELINIKQTIDSKIS